MGMGWGLHVVTWSHLILLRIPKISEGWSHTVFTPAEATTSTRTFEKLPSVNCYLARENLVISMIHMPWLLLRQVLQLGLLDMYRVPYLRFPICSFSSGVKCWYGDRLDVTVVTSHVTTAYNFAEKTFTNWLQTAKFAKVFSLESFPLYGIRPGCVATYLPTYS